MLYNVRSHDCFPGTRLAVGHVISNKFTDLYDKREAFNFTIVNYPHMDSNIPSKPAYGVFISQLIRYLRVCGNYQHFVYRSVQITTRLQRQGFDYVVLCNTFKKFLRRHPIALHYVSISGAIGK